MISGILKAIEHTTYTMDIINMYDKPKALDVGYRCIHLQFSTTQNVFHWKFSSGHKKMHYSISIRMK